MHTSMRVAMLQTVPLQTVFEALIFDMTIRFRFNTCYKGPKLAYTGSTFLICDCV